MLPDMYSQRENIIKKILKENPELDEHYVRYPDSLLSEQLNFWLKSPDTNPKKAQEIDKILKVRLFKAKQYCEETP